MCVGIKAEKSAKFRLQREAGSSLIFEDIKIPLTHNVGYTGRKHC